MVTYLSIPHVLSSTREEHWNRRYDSKLYYLARFNLALCERPTGPIKMGEIVAVHRAEDAQVETIWSIEATVTTVDFKESMREAIFSKEVSNELTSSISSTLGVDGMASLKIASEAGVAIKKTLRETITARNTLQSTITNSDRRTFTVKNTRNFRDTPGTYFTVLPFQEVRADVYAVWFDYLEVRYRRYPLDLRRKRVKNPPFTETRPRVNEWELREPLGGFSYWKLMPSDAFQVHEDTYLPEVPDATVVTRSAIENPKTFRKENYPRVPSLYQLSNVAFPLKWIARNDDWTEADLLGVEEEERRERAWWFKYRRPS
jgi:hypothetical protein